MLVNADDEDLVERKDDGRFNRPSRLQPQELPAVYFGVRDGDTGDWLVPMYPPARR